MKEEWKEFIEPLKYLSVGEIITTVVVMLGILSLLFI